MNTLKNNKKRDKNLFTIVFTVSVILFLSGILIFIYTEVSHLIVWLIFAASVLLVLFSSAILKRIENPLKLKEPTKSKRNSKENNRFISGTIIKIMYGSIILAGLIAGTSWVFGLTSKTYSEPLFIRYLVVILIAITMVSFVVLSLFDHSK